MDEKECYEFSITVYSYKHVVDKFKEKNNLTFEEVREKLEAVLQMPAWGDAFPDMQASVDWENSPEEKKFIEEQRIRTRGEEVMGR